MSLELERTYNLDDKINFYFFIKVGSETAEISINKTISNICGAPKYSIILNQPL